MNVSLWDGGKDTKDPLVLADSNNCFCSSLPSVFLSVLDSKRNFNWLLWGNGKQWWFQSVTSVSSSRKTPVNFCPFRWVFFRPSGELQRSACSFTEGWTSLYEFVRLIKKRQTRTSPVGIMHWTWRINLCFNSSVYTSFYSLISDNWSQF